MPRLLRCFAHAAIRHSNRRRKNRKYVSGGTTYAPYFYRNIGGNYTGIDVEIAEEACARIGYEPIFVELDIDKGFELLNEDYVVAFGAA